MKNRRTVLALALGASFASGALVSGGSMQILNAQMSESLAHAYLYSAYNSLEEGNIPDALRDAAAAGALEPSWYAPRLCTAKCLLELDLDQAALQEIRGAQSILAEKESLSPPEQHDLKWVEKKLNDLGGEPENPE